MFTRRRGGRSPFKVRQRKAAAMDKLNLPDHPMNAWEGEKYLGGKTTESTPSRKRTVRRRRRY